MFCANSCRPNSHECAVSTRALSTLFLREYGPFLPPQLTTTKSSLAGVEPHGQFHSLCWKRVWFGLLWVMCTLTSPWWVPLYSHPLPLTLNTPRLFHWSLSLWKTGYRIHDSWGLTLCLSLCTWDCCGLCADCHLWQTEAYLTNHSFLSTVYENKLHP